MPDVHEYAQAGIKAVNEHQFSKAIEAFEKALEIEPERPDMNNALGMAHLHRGDAVNAIPFLSKAIELARGFEGDEYDDMKVHFIVGLATAQHLLEQTQQTIATLKTAAELWPENIVPLLHLGQLYFEACLLEEGLSVYRKLSTLESLDEEARQAAEAVVGSVEAFLNSEHTAGLFLQAHQESYIEYFNEVAAPQEQAGWFAEATRMSQDADGELKPMLAEGARPYALTRADLVNPKDNTVANVYEPSDPLIVHLNGLEPLAQLPIMFPWKEFPFEVWVSSQSPWHWLKLAIQFEDDLPDESELVKVIDDLIGAWYLKGFNGEFGTQEAGRFHYVSDPETIGTRTVNYTFDLGRAEYSSIDALLRALTIFHDQRAIKRVLFGRGLLPEL